MNRGDLTNEQWERLKTLLPPQKPTIRWVFQLFEGLDILLVKQNGEVLLRQLLNLRPAQEQ